MSADNLISKLLKGDKRSISRAITKIEQKTIESKSIINKIYSHTGNAFRIGITGPPGAGKSTLTNKLTKFLTENKYSVGIIAIDPSSPFTGGALLGDRVRMNDIGMLENVYIRSMASRGSLGGLSASAIDAADILDAAGFDFIIFESVGVGQSELDIAEAADTTIVVLVPESGDSIQAMKAGLMEIADIFVLNKSDRPGAENAKMSIQSILSINTIPSEWDVPIVQTIATENNGLDNLLDEINKHRNHLLVGNRLNKFRMNNSKSRISNIINEMLNTEVLNQRRNDELMRMLEKSLSDLSSPYELALKIIDDYKNEIKK